MLLLIYLFLIVLGLFLWKLLIPDEYILCEKGDLDKGVEKMKFEVMGIGKIKLYELANTYTEAYEKALEYWSKCPEEEKINGDIIINKFEKLTDGILSSFNITSLKENLENEE